MGNNTTVFSMIYKGFRANTPDVSADPRVAYAQALNRQDIYVHPTGNGKHDYYINASTRASHPSERNILEWKIVREINVERVKSFILHDYRGVRLASQSFYAAASLGALHLLAISEPRSFEALQDMGTKQCSHKISSHAGQYMSASSRNKMLASFESCVGDYVENQYVDATAKGAVSDAGFVSATLGLAMIFSLIAAKRRHEVEVINVISEGNEAMLKKVMEGAAPV